MAILNDVTLIKAKAMIFIERFSISNAPRIALRLHGDNKILDEISTLTDGMYDATLSFWHIPFTYSALREFLRLKIPYCVVDHEDHELIKLGKRIRADQSQVTGTTQDRSMGDTNGIASHRDASSKTPLPVVAKALDIEGATPHLKIEWSSKGFAIQIPYRQSEVLFLKGLDRCFWHNGVRKWIAKSTLYNLRALQERYRCWEEDSYRQLVGLIQKKENPFILELYQTPEFPRSVMIKLRGHARDITHLKSISDRCYDRTHRRWIIPYDRQIIDRLCDHYQQRGARIIDRLPGEPKVYQKDLRTWADRRDHLIKKFQRPHQAVLRAYIDCLIRLRYSWNTVRSYVGAFCKYIDYLHPRSPEKVGAVVANQYLSSIAGRRVSESLIHLTVNAIKFYYDKVTFVPEFALEKVQRPKKGRYLPTILSTAEVDRMLRSLSNLKHICLLYALYGGGLRLNELLSLRVKDLHWDRNQVLVKGGKGKKDRMVMLSQTLKEILVLYFNEYQPIYWLFEGAEHGKPYSSKSVQKVVRKAARLAGITRRVTTHTLRHCFATHLLDRGTDVRFIQELLGHKDIRTTLVYTHVTTNQVTGIRSPLDTIRISDLREKGRNDI